MNIKDANIITYFFAIICFFLVSCDMMYDRDVIKCNGLTNKPIHIYFVTLDEGYAFCNEGHLYDESIAEIYKTVDGGKNWERIHSMNNYLYTGTSIKYGGKIYSYIKNTYDIKCNFLVCFNLVSNDIDIIDYEINGIGNLCSGNDSIYATIYSSNSHYLLSVDTLSLNVSRKTFPYIAKENGMVSIDSNIYLITYNNEFIEVLPCATNVLRMKNPLFLSKTYDNKIILLAGDESDCVSLFEYDTYYKEMHNVHTFKGYNMVYDLRTDNNITICVLGILERHTVKYDFLCTTDKRNWKNILSTRLDFQPNCLSGNSLWRATNNQTIEKITIDR